VLLKHSSAWILAVLLLAGCASTGVRRRDPSLSALLQDKPRAGLGPARFSGMESGVGSLVGLSSTAKQAARVDELCLAAFDEALSQSADLAWIPRAPDPNSGVGEHALKVHLSAAYGILPGFSKRLCLDVEWVVLSVDGRELATIATAVASDERVGSSPGKLDPRHQPIWAELARRSALDFLDFLAGRAPRYER
jgi:hypothetical protein